MPTFFYSPETAIVVSFAVVILVGTIRGLKGGAFFEPDKNVSDGLAGVSIFVTILLWYGLFVNMEQLVYWSEQPLGVLSITAAMIWVVSSRMQKLIHSCGF